MTSGIRCTPSGSLPARERGLKLVLIVLLPLFPASLPARERGLKHFYAVHIYFVSRVAPRAGAWIETQRYPRKPRPSVVAPRAGAWIETYCPHACGGEPTHLSNGAWPSSSVACNWRCIKI